MKSVQEVLEELNVYLLPKLDIQRMSKLILRIEKALDKSERAVNWKNVGRFTSTSTLPIFCKNDSTHQEVPIVAENIYSPSKGISRCYECKFNCNIKEMIGKKNGMLTINSAIPCTSGYSINLTCDCGKNFNKPINSILSSEQKTCGSVECIQVHKGHKHWENSINKTFGMQTLIKIIGKTETNNSVGLFKCAASNCLSNENNTKIRNTSSIDNGEYNKCPCEAWIDPSKAKAIYEIEIGLFCNNLSFAYKRLTNSLLPSDKIKISLFRSRIKKYINVLNKNNTNNELPFISNNVLLSFLNIGSTGHCDAIFYSYLIFCYDKPIYTGITCNIERRKHEHFYCGSNKGVTSSIKKFGIENHRIQIIKESSNFNVIAKHEIETIKKHNLIEDGFNSCIGGAANPLVKDIDHDLIAQVYNFYKNIEPRNYPNMNVVDEELNIDISNLRRIFQLLVRRGGIQPYRTVRGTYNELSEEDKKGLKIDIKDKKSVISCVEKYNVQKKYVDKLRYKYLSETGELTSRGNTYKITSDERNFIALCLEFGYSYRHIKCMLKPSIPNIPEKIKNEKIYTFLYTKKSASELFDLIKKKCIEYNVVLKHINSAMANSSAAGYAQQELLDKLIRYYCNGNSLSFFTYRNTAIGLSSCYDAINLIRKNKMLRLRNGIEQRLNYSELRELVCRYDFKYKIFGRFISDKTILMIAIKLSEGFSFTKIAKIVSFESKETVTRKFISKHRKNIIFYANNIGIQHINYKLS